MDFISNRLNICKKCPLYSDKGICNNRLYLNIETGDTITYPKKGYINGCGCIIDVKVKNKNSVCPLKKW